MDLGCSQALMSDFKCSIGGNTDRDDTGANSVAELSALLCPHALIQLKLNTGPEREFAVAPHPTDALAFKALLDCPSEAALEV